MRSEGERGIEASGEEAMKGLQAWWGETVRVWERERERTWHALLGLFFSWPCGLLC